LKTLVLIEDLKKIVQKTIIAWPSTKDKTNLAKDTAYN